MADYIFSMCADETGTAQQKDDQARAKSEALRQQLLPWGDRPPQPHRPLTGTVGQVPQNEGYAVGVTGAEAGLSPEQLARVQTGLPEGWGIADLGGGV